MIMLSGLTLFGWLAVRIDTINTKFVVGKEGQEEWVDRQRVGL